ncbi:uncharacterized protein LODBEIA_P30390 [Lodderomyces beijingensis]|uniref:ORC6 first cyclin-like domain-containing protein n=1 Tax=Lodderomyces beijingensis TaxID=1775926 RepID=A0ABP0ZKZ7_9ASCO
MSNAHINQAVKELIPAYGGPKTAKLIGYINSLYNLSVRSYRVLPNHAEIGRYHLCAYVIIEKYRTLFELPQPDISRIPIQPHVASKLLDDFRDFVGQISAGGTPTSTPKKKATENSLSTTPREKMRQSSSPLKRLHMAAAAAAAAAEEEEEEEEEDNETSNTRESARENKRSRPPLSPKKDVTPANPTQRKKYRYDLKNVSIVDFITFCNTFYIPAVFTKQMLNTFYLHKHKFAKKTDWSLACGIVYTAYTRINHRLLASKVGSKSELMALLLQYQKGGLSKQALDSWCSLVEEWVKNECWVQEIEKQYVYANKANKSEQERKENRARIGENWDLLERYGAMIHGEHLFQSPTQRAYFDTWTGNALKIIERQNQEE